MAKKKSKKANGYFGLGWILSIIFAIIPITNILFGIVIRVKKQNVLGVVLNIILMPVFYIIDLISIILKNKIFVLA